MNIYPYCKKHVKQTNGKSPIIIYLKKKGKPKKEFNTGIKVEADYFDNKAKTFLKGSGQTARLNFKLSEILNELESIVANHDNISAERVIEIFKLGTSSKSFYEFSNTRLKAERSKLSFKGWEQYNYCIEVVKRFDSDLDLKEINPEKLELLRDWMEYEGLSQTTQAHVYKTIRKFIRIAMRQGFVKENPFEKGFVIGTPKTAEKEWNSLDEIDKLFELLKEDKLSLRLKSTLIHYLHSCHTGLRSIDQRRFNPKEHVDGNFIKIVPSKSKDISDQPLLIPLNNRAKSLHAEMEHLKLKIKANRLSEDLKEIMKMIGVTRRITYHCSRHSFAINSLVVGVPLEVVSKWLGHRNISTTQIYARIADSLSTKEMNKWNQEQDKIETQIVDDNGISMVFSFGPNRFKSRSFVNHENLFQFLMDNLYNK